MAQSAQIILISDVYIDCTSKLSAQMAQVCAALSNTSSELESRGPRSRSGSLQGQGAVTPGTARRLAKVDKAAVAFKVGGSVQLFLCAY